MAKKKAAAAGGEDEFDKLAKSTEYKNAWKEARKVDAEGFGSNPTLPDGNYICRITGAKVGVTKKEPKFPYLTIDTVILKGEHQGVKIGHFFNLGPEKMEYAVKALKRLEYEIDDAELSDIKGMAADLTKSKPVCEIAAQNKTVDVVDPKDKKKKVKKDVCNFYINKALEESDAE
jgi:hypothetical protein